MSLSLNYGYASDFIKENDLIGLYPAVKSAHETINQKNGLGNDFLGWVTLPFDYDKEEFDRIKKAAEKIKNDTDVLIVIGIGGSYLGARAAIEFLKGPYYNSLRDGVPEIYFAGNSISGSYLADMLKLCEGKRVSVNVISKSGTTTEPAVAFRVFRKYLEEKYGEKEAASRIYCTTDKARGTLKALADEKGYECFVVPDDVGGRFSVLTAVGLLPIAAAGADIDKLMQGAAKAAEKYNNPDIENNDCYTYAALRNAFYRKGKSVELLVSYEPRFTMMAEWFKQLFGESEGKDNKGLFPASVVFSTDLHSMGQFIQDGSRLMFETVVTFDENDEDLQEEIDIPKEENAVETEEEVNEDESFEEPETNDFIESINAVDPTISETLTEDRLKYLEDTFEDDSNITEEVEETPEEPVQEETEEVLTEDTVSEPEETIEEDDEFEESNEPTEDVFNSPQWDNEVPSVENVLAENDTIEDVATTESDTICEEEIIEPETVEDNIVQDEIDEPNSTEEEVTQVVEKPVATNTTSPTSKIQDDIKSVLVYMDQLLENLPEEKIEEFAKSEHFDTYKKLFSELGISN